jgi:hypothetical protein
MVSETITQSSNPAMKGGISFFEAQRLSLKKWDLIIEYHISHTNDLRCLYDKIICGDSELKKLFLSCGFCERYHNFDDKGISQCYLCELDCWYIFGKYIHAKTVKKAMYWAKRMRAKIKRIKDSGALA